MQRVAPSLLRGVQSCCSGSAGGALEAAAATTQQQARALSSYAFSGIADAPPPAGSKAISLKVGGDAANVAVDVKAGKASAQASYPASSIRRLQASPLTLYEAPRVSVLHSSLLEYVVALAHERYSILAQWPDFSTMFGKDYYYRSHPEELKKFYSLVDEFHRMWDVVTEFDSLSHLATQMVPGYRKRHMNVLGPAVSPTIANGIVVQQLLAHAK